MSKELVIAANRHEIKVGILEDDQLVEVFFQRANEYSLAGSIHKGRVTRVLPGMQSAFVDLGPGTRYVPVCLGLFRRDRRGLRSRIGKPRSQPFGAGEPAASRASTGPGAFAGPGRGCRSAATGESGIR